MRKLQRDQLVDYQTWSDRRPTEFPAILAIKQPRRIHVGEYLTFLFENAETIRWQVQEMMRVEHIVRESDIQREVETYNELLGDDGELGCTLLIEIDDPEQRDVRLRAWLGLPYALYLELEDGTKARAIVDERQVATDRLSAVQYLKFHVGDSAPVAIGTDLDVLELRTELTDAQHQALQADLDS